jgi:hypothetical protein
MRTIVITFALLATLSAAHGAKGFSPSPETAVRDFYSMLMKARPQPLSRQLKALSVFLGQNLNRLIANAQNAGAAYLKKYPTDKGILGDGTCFFYGGGDCSFTSYKVTNTSRTGDLVNVTVQLTLVDNRPGYPSASWDNMVELNREKDRWVINDIEYFDSKASKILKESTGEARSAVQR